MKTILVTDDEPILLTLLHAYLSQRGFSVLSARSGAEALQRYRQHEGLIDLVLLDVRMPGLDGPETLDALRAAGLTAPAVFMSGEFGDYESQDLLHRGVCHILHKPFSSLEEVGRALWKLTEGRPEEVCKL